MTISFRHVTLGLGLTLASLAAAAPAQAQDTGGVPYWASIRPDELNMRVGPGEEYRILWVYHRPNLPLKVLRVKEGWRFVRDPDGAQGWVHSRFLTRKRGAHVIGKEPADMRESADLGSRLLWRVAPGVTGLLGECGNGWCAFTVGERSGFVAQSRLWGAGDP